MSDKQTTTWYKKLLNQLNVLAEQFELDDLQLDQFRDFSVNLAKEQFRAGNKSGIAWAYKQIRENNQHSQTVGV